MKGAWPAILVAGVVVLGACAQKPVPPDTFYRLKAEAPAAVHEKPKLDGTLSVDRFDSDALIAGRHIVHRSAEAPYQLVEYDYHFWAQSPTVMLRDELVAYLRAAKTARAVVTPEMRVDTDYLLAGTIKSLEKVDDAPAKVVAEVEFALRPRNGRKMLLLETYRAEVEAAGEDVAAAVLALNGVLTDIFGRLLQDLDAIP